MRPTIEVDDLDRMRDALFFSGMRKRAKTSKFWVLLVLAGVIATLGVMQDSTATVIGAMIVAPLMTPIIGVALAFVLTDRGMLGKSVLFVVVGALVVIAIGFLFGALDATFSSVGNSQVSSRVSPAMIDLVAALATGLVGAFALVRPDVSDTLPGVAIAISLVPPLAVCGLVLQEGLYGEAFGAFVLFSTNVTAIIFTGTLTLLFYEVRDVAKAAGHEIKDLTKKSLAAIFGLVLVVMIPLAFGSYQVIYNYWVSTTATPIANAWAEANNWSVSTVTVKSGVLTVAAIGQPPSVNGEELRAALDDAGLEDIELDVELVIGGTKSYPPGS
ncbi:MAG: DUF389 domain-containing protein [Actinobacteria bacterium]|nr:DUF389 domain-containing protein [Actinomycetota bacterium]